MDTAFFHKRILLLAILFFSITAYFSRGFHHFDEHFQILEFAGAKLGISQGNNLPWEYTSQIRSAFQPAIVVVLIKAMKWVGISSPFVWAFGIRLLAGFISLACIYCSCAVLTPTILPRHQKLFILLSYFLYFIPYIAVRFSSETFGACFFMLGFSLLFWACTVRDKGPMGFWWAVGLLWGLSFISRFQCGIMIAGGLLWLIFIQRLSIAKIFAVLVGLGMVIGVGVLIDHWFYGQWLFTPWNYFRTDVLFADAVRFGTSPWYYYASELYQADAKSAIKLIVLLGAIHYIYYHRRGIITFVVIPFVLIHLFIGHKEMRFMIPVAFFAPYFTVVFWQYFTQRIHSEWSGHIQRLIVFQALFINMISLAVTAFKPADGQPLVYEYLYDRYKSTAYNIYYIEKGGNFFWSQGLLPMNFYNPSKNKISPIDRDAIMSLSASGQPCDNIVIADRRQDLSDLPLKAVYTHKPDWLLTLDLNDWMKIKNDDWIVYQVIAKYPSKKT